MSSSSFDTFCNFNSSVSGFDKKKRSSLFWFLLFVLWINHQIFEQVENVIRWKNNLRALTGDFTAFSHAIGNWFEKPCIFYVVKNTIGWYRKKKEEKYSYFGRRYGYQFPRLPQLGEFPCIFLYYGKLMGETHQFSIWKSIPQDGNPMEKATIPLKLYGNQFLRFSPFDGFCCLFPCYGKLMRKTHAFPMWWSVPQDGNLKEKNAHTTEIVWEPISQVFPFW